MVKTVPRQKAHGVVTATLKAAGEDFVSQPVDQLELTYEGIAGDYHSGITRNSGGREPWYERGTQIRNERQLSILSSAELQDIADNLDVDRVEPGWIGGNLVIDEIPDLSLLPSRTLLFFEGGVTLRVDGYNAPCRVSGASVAKYLGGGSRATDGIFDSSARDISLDFAPAARLKRGLVAWVEREGVIRPGEKVTAHIWEQWIYEVDQKS